jgi:hypothetical protein
VTTLCVFVTERISSEFSRDRQAIASALYFRGFSNVFVQRGRRVCNIGVLDGPAVGPAPSLR